MPLPQFSIVRLLSDRHRDEGASIGATGTIVEVYDDDAYEVEFSDTNGITIALLALPQDEVEPDTDVPAFPILRAGD